MRRSGLSTLLALALTAAACSSTPQTPEPAPAADPKAPELPSAGPGEDLKAAAEVAGRAAGATWRATRVAGSEIGEAAGTAVHGLTHGFEEPEAEDDYGRPPVDYPAPVRHHFLRFLGVSEQASFRFGRPVRGTMNKGILRGGGIAWRGYLLDVEVESREGVFGDARRSQKYVVRLRDGQIVDVHRGSAAENAFLMPVESPPASPRR